MAVSKRTRFEVFKRDAFACQYCGRTPPAVMLHVDHVIASANGGSDTIENLVTSCCDCNLGKSDVSLSCVPAGISENIGLIQEKKEQLEEYTKLLKSVARAKRRSIKSVADHFTALYPGFSLKERFQNSSVAMFLEHFAAEELNTFLNKAAGVCRDDQERAIKYFCGICWGKIKNDGRNEGRR